MNHKWFVVFYSLRKTANWLSKAVDIYCPWILHTFQSRARILSSWVLNPDQAFKPDDFNFKQLSLSAKQLCYITYILKSALSLISILLGQYKSGLLDWITFQFYRCINITKANSGSCELRSGNLTLILWPVVHIVAYACFPFKSDFWYVAKLVCSARPLQLCSYWMLSSHLFTYLQKRVRFY